MKLSEIKVGDDYEIKQYGVGTIGKVVEIGTFKITTYSGRSMCGNTTEHKGVRVVFPHNRADVVNWFLPQQIVRPAEAARVAKAKHEAVSKSMEAYAARINAALAKKGFTYSSAYVSTRGGYRRVVLSLESEMAHLLEILEAD